MPLPRDYTKDGGVFLPSLAATCAALLLVLGATPAMASVAYIEKSSFGSPGSDPSQFEGPAGVAVDQSTGDIYVVDSVNARVQKFGPKGEFLLMFGAEVNETTKGDVCTQAEIQQSGVKCKAGAAGSAPGQLGVAYVQGIFAGGPAGIAVEPGTGDVYVVDRVNKRIEKFGPQGAYLSETNGGETPAGEFTFSHSEAGGVAVDPVEDNTYGGHDLYVANYEYSEVDIFDSAGDHIGQLAVEQPTAIAFDASGNAYVIAREEKVIYRFPHGAAPGAPLSLEGGLDAAEALTVSSTAELLVFEHEEQSHGRVAVFTSMGEKVTMFGEGKYATTTDRGGVAINLATNEAYFAGGGTRRDEPEYDKVTVFERKEASPPEAETASAKDVTGTAATLTGLVNPEGAPGEFWFEYGLGEAYANEAPLPHGYAGDGSSATSVEARVTDLEPHSTYHYLLVAKNTYGTTEAGEAKELTTASEAPKISGERVNPQTITQESAELKAEVNPNNEPSSWRFEFSTNPTLSGATAVPSPEGTLSSAYSDEKVQAVAGGLQPNTLYYYRTLASNAGGGGREGATESLLTLPATPTTEAAANVDDHSATLSGSFDPGDHATSYYFEYGTAPCGTTCGTQTSVAGPVTGDNEIQPTVAVSDLAALTTYHYRVVVKNATGPSYGPERELTTLPEAPAVTTGPPTNVAATTATVAGEIVPQCVEGRYSLTSYRFEYGPTIAYGGGGEGAAISPASCLAGGEAVSLTITGLDPNTLYHYRLVARNAGGETFGIDQSLTTNPNPQPSTAAAAGFLLTGTSPTRLAASTFPELTSLTPLPTPSATETGKPAKPKIPSCEAKAKRIKNQRKREAAVKDCKKVTAKRRKK